MRTTPPILAPLTLAAFVGLLLGPYTAAPARSSVLAVPDDYATIQKALDAAWGGDTVLVAGGVYFEKIALPRSGNPTDGLITLKAAPGQVVVLDGSGVTGDDMILIDTKSWVKIEGLELRNNFDTNDGSGVRVIGSGSHIEIRDNRIHDMRGQHAMGITVYGTEAEPISELVIDGNEIYDCEPANSEALTLNGNVTGFEVTNNLVRDVNNIGIDFIGGETDIQSDTTKVARNGVCRGNTVVRARSNYGGGWAAGIYVDGGRDIVIENNTVSGSDMGIEVGAENAGMVTTGIKVRNNVIYDNDKSCIVFGGYSASVGRAEGNEFTGNTCYRNDTAAEGLGELWVQWANDNLVTNNIFYTTEQNVLLYSETATTGNHLDFNLWYSPADAGSAEFTWQGQWHEGFSAYRANSGQDQGSLFTDPLLAAPGQGDFHLLVASPAVDAGDPTHTPASTETDLDGAGRMFGSRIDIGADEHGSGCDTDCTPAACGDGILSDGEQCDDDSGCCSSECLYLPASTACDDDELCTTSDVCDAAGVCVGSVEPELPCKLPVKAKGSALVLKNKDNDDKDRLVWKWAKGQATSLSELGNPLADTFYSLCLYDQAGEATGLGLAAATRTGTSCASKPCWRSLGEKGFKYRDRSASPEGLQSLLLRSGGEGKAKVKVKGRGGLLSMPSLPLAQDPALSVQLRSSTGACWGAAFSAPALAADATRFKDKSD